jgi:hypothetical protein
MAEARWAAQNRLQTKILVSQITHYHEDADAKSMHQEQSFINFY